MKLYDETTKLSAVILNCTEIKKNVSKSFVCGVFISLNLYNGLNENILACFKCVIFLYFEMYPIKISYLQNQTKM